MSIKLMLQALNVSGLNSSDKLVLMKLADNASDDGECWPSMQHVIDHTGLSKSTVLRSIKRLIEQGHVTKQTRFDSDGRQTSNVYNVNIREGVNLTRGGCHSDTGGVSSGHGGGCHGDTQTCHSESVIEPDSASRPRAHVTRPDSIDKQVWDDWKRTRKAPLTVTAWKKIEKELSEGVQQGHDPNDMLSLAIERAWRGFQLSWYLRAIEQTERDEGKPSASWDAVLSAAARSSSDRSQFIEKHPDLRDAINAAGGMKQLGLMNEWQLKEARERFMGAL